ncbi:MAG TPA: endoribonuclease MazF [Thermoanaerobaculia bacterium]|nr:endoribonuclease MazF [Thermoanaerobaculia bacterium]
MAKRSGDPSYVPKRGDAVWLDFDPQAGHEQAGRRPAVVLSPRPYNEKVGLAVVCPITSQQKGYPFEVAIPPRLPISGVVLSDQVKNIDWHERRAAYICTLSTETVTEILKKLALLISPEFR